MGTITDFVQQIMDAFMGFSAPGIDPMLFFGTLFLIFAILWMALKKVKLFGTENDIVNGLIALIIAYFAASSSFTTVLLASIFPNFSIAVVAIIVFLIIIAVVSGDEAGFADKRVPYFITAVIILWFMYLTLNQIGAMPEIGISGGMFWESWDATDWFIVILLVGGIIYFLKPQKLLGS
jgi:hypothetical protein